MAKKLYDAAVEVLAKLHAEAAPESSLPGRQAALRL